MHSIKLKNWFNITDDQLRRMSSHQIHAWIKKAKELIQHGKKLRTTQKSLRTFFPMKQKIPDSIAHRDNSNISTSPGHMTPTAVPEQQRGPEIQGNSENKNINNSATKSSPKTQIPSHPQPHYEIDDHTASVTNKRKDHPSKNKLSLSKHHKSSVKYERSISSHSQCPQCDIKKMG